MDKSLKTVDRSVQILNCFTRQTPSLTLGELGKVTGLPKPTLLRFCETLTAHGLLDRQGAAWRLGFKLLDYANVLLSSLDLNRLARPVLQRLVDQVQETAHLVVYEDGHIIYLDKVEPLSPIYIVSAVGRRLPAYCTAAGKVLLAHQPAEEVARWLAEPMPALTPNTITDPNQLRTILARARSEGFATDNEETQIGLRCVAAPVFDHSGKVVAAVSMSGPIYRMTTAGLPDRVRDVQDCARQISLQFGHRNSSSPLGPAL